MAFSLRACSRQMQLLDSGVNEPNAGSARLEVDDLERAPADVKPDDGPRAVGRGAALCDGWPGRFRLFR